MAGKDIRNLKYVPELITNPIIYDNNIKKLSELIRHLTVGPSTIDMTHIREGIVLRIENKDGVDFLKEKSFEFKLLEGIIKDDSNYVDLEEVEVSNK
jgi:hypothetical protein